MNLSLKTDLKQIIALLVLLVLAGAALIVWAGPQYNTFKSQLTTTNATKASLKSVDQEIKQIDTLDQDVHSLSDANIIKLNKALPARDDLEEFLLNMHKLAQGANLVIMNLDVKPVETQYVSGSQTVSPDLNISDLNMAVRGEYGSITSFLQSLQRYARLIDIGSLDVQNVNQGGKTSILEARFTAQIYSLKAIPDAPLFPFGETLDKTLLSTKQFEDLQILAVTVPVSNTGLTNPFAP